MPFRKFVDNHILPHKYFFKSSLWDSTGKNYKIVIALWIGKSLQPVNQVSRWSWMKQKKYIKKSRGTVPLKLLHNRARFFLCTPLMQIILEPSLCTLSPQPSSVLPQTISGWRPLPPPPQLHANKVRGGALSRWPLRQQTSSKCQAGPGRKVIENSGE
jgi:hypothetical protein